MSQIKQTRESLKGMTDEEKKLRKKEQMRIYMNKRRQEDPEFAKKQRELCANRMKVLRENPDFVDKEREYFRNYQRNMKKAYNELKKSQSQSTANYSLKIDSVSYF